jgi:pimeloyl-ACP methyl ester carboxylesterase
MTMKRRSSAGRLPVQLQPTEHRFRSFDGIEIAWSEIGPEADSGRPLVLLHGLFSNAAVNWVKFGTAQRLADAGFRVIMPDFRAHGKSAAPQDAAHYPADVLATDTLALIDHLGLRDYDLGGYSLGGRQTLRCVARGARPQRIAVVGMGLKGIIDSAGGTRWFMDAVENRDAHAKGSEAYFAVQFMTTNKVDPQAALNVLAAQVDSTRDEVAAIALPALVLCGAEDHYNAEARALAATLPDAVFKEMPGTHMSSVSRPELGEALAAFFAA